MIRFSFVIVILFIFGCQAVTKELPILSYTINSKGQKEYYTITYSDFINQDGQEVSTTTIKDKIVVSNFFFTRCPSICPPMRNVMISIANDFRNEDDLILISHTIDPENDTRNVLKNYANNTKIPTEKWLFVRSSEARTKRQAKEFMTNFRPNEEGTDFYHSSYVSLIDKNQMIRGFYNVLVAEEVQRLKRDIKSIL